jgi:hypothetical protein
MFVTCPKCDCEADITLLGLGQFDIVNEAEAYAKCIVVAERHAQGQIPSSHLILACPHMAEALKKGVS